MLTHPVHTFLSLIMAWLFLPFVLQVSQAYGCDRHVHLSFPQAAVTNVNTIYIPFSQIGQLIAVQARIDTQEGSFIFDTGAERLLLNTQHFKPLNAVGEVAAVGNTGLVNAVQNSRVDSVHIDQLFFPDVLAHLVDLSHLEDSKNTRILGVLGYQIYKDFEVFIDFPNLRIVLSRVDRRGTRIDSIGMWEKPVDSLNFMLKNHVIILSTAVNGVRLEMMLDSGAELNLLDRRVRRKVLDHFTILKRVNLIGAGQREVEVLAGVLRDVYCGNVHCKAMNTLLTNMDEVNAGFGTSLDGVMGYEFLNARRVMINYQKQKLYFFGPLRP